MREDEEKKKSYDTLCKVGADAWIKQALYKHIDIELTNQTMVALCTVIYTSTRVTDSAVARLFCLFSKLLLPGVIIDNHDYNYSIDVLRMIFGQCRW